MVACNTVAIILYLVILILAMNVDSSDIYNDLSIYTQAADDWTNKAWIEFTWGTNSECPDGYEFVDMSNTWLGTVEGNYTDDGGVTPTDSQWNGPIPPKPSVIQPITWAGTNGAIVCG